MKQIHWTEGLRETMEHLSGRGVFLTVGGKRPNTMTIGWGWIGYCWKKPVFVAVVRPQRYTYDILKETGEFTVSVPTANEMKDELVFAGTKSGRDVDKFSGHGLTTMPGQSINVPVIAQCGLHFECRTLLVQDMTPDQMDPSIAGGIYPTKDFHTMFFGEIVNCYRTDD